MTDSEKASDQDLSQKREPEINKFFRAATKTRASDLHLKVGQPPKLRIQDDLKSTTGEPFTEQRLEQICFEILTDDQKQFFLKHGTLDLSYGVTEEERFRVNLFRQRGFVSLVARRVNTEIPTIEQLNLPQTLKKIADCTQGLVLCVGPTGCGKTTTLYSALQEINTVDLKIITTEDPVEYDIEGIMQVAVNEEIGVTFASCLRSIVRQDPDVILVGEIRDLETAEMAIEASLTGHLVFSTLHTNDAPTAITRLIELEVQPFLISATMQAVVAQRLVRKICPRCKTEFVPTEEMLYELGLRREDIGGNKFHYGRRCMECNHTGYKGRTAIFETLVITERLRQMIMDGASSSAIREAAREEGMLTLRERGLRLIFEGVTTVEEIIKETIQTI